MDPRSSSGSSAYGSAGASGQFDFATFIRKPPVILRMGGLVSGCVLLFLRVLTRIRAVSNLPDEASPADRAQPL